MAETKYGIISDVHDNPIRVSIAIEVLKGLGADKLIGNGDLGERQPTLQASQDYVAQILQAFGESGLESHVQPGSHESVGAFFPVLNYFTDQFSNIISVFDVPKIEHPGHHLVFLPGSDSVCGGEFHLGSNPIETGLYLELEEGLAPYTRELHTHLLQRNLLKGLLHYTNVHDLEQLVTEPDKTTVVCHIPKKFQIAEGAVDTAYFGKKEDKSIIPGAAIEAMIRQRFGIVSDADVRLIAARNGISMKKENCGNKELQKLYEEIGITKAVNGHFHESGQRAHDAHVQPLPQGEFVDELYWNTGQLDLGQCGILTVCDGKVSYQNVNINEYVRYKIQ